MTSSRTTDLYVLRQGLLEQEERAGLEADAGMPGGYERWAATCDQRLEVDEAILETTLLSDRDLSAKIGIIAGRALAFDVADELRRLVGQMTPA